MTLDELLPAARSLPQPDKVRLIQLLAGDLLPAETIPALPLPGDYPLWSPYDSSEAATVLLATLAADAQRA